MDPAAVAAYYRAKGYIVRDNARVASPAGTEHRVPLLAEGPLGSLAVFFGDFGGVDGPEMGGARKVAREVGATPVLAADEFSNQDRQLAARLGVVLIDAATLAGEDGPLASSSPAPLGLGADTGRAWPGLAPIPTRRSKESEAEQHPWPASGRVGGRDGPATRAVDVDEILANPGVPPAPASEESGPVTMPSDASALPPAGPESDEADDRDGEGLWKRPRDRQAAAPKRPRTPASQRFAWLGADVPPAASPGTAALAVEYDDAVPASLEGEADDAETADEERLGESIELLPTLDEARRQAARDALMRRLFWILFAAVVLYLVALWWL